tara:strand:- start:1017 stop:1121 length:105 start_codon:yes stop_codon:yes gene_type:complete
MFQNYTYQKKVKKNKPWYKTPESYSVSEEAQGDR